MGSMHITRRYRFCAAHRLHTPQLSDEDNWTVFGKCNNPNGHGHNYVVFVTVASQAEGGAHPWLSIEDLDRIVAERIVARFDHQDLNRDPGFASQTTTGENLVVLMWEILAGVIPQGQLQKVGVIETRDNYFEYSGSSSAAERTGSASY